MWPDWKDSIKKRACRYLLQRYLGQYLQEKLTLEQLSVNVFQGTGTIRDLNLDVEALNEMGEVYNLPLQFVDGYIKSVDIQIPWVSLLKESSFVEVQGLMITIQPKYRSSNASVMDSIVGSVLMTTSLDVAREWLEKEEYKDTDKEPDNPLEGLEMFAQTIDTVLRRVKVRFVDTTFRLEHVPIGSKTGMALEIRVKKIDYFDEAGTGVTKTENENKQNNGNEAINVACKSFHWEGISLHSDEFCIDPAELIKSSLYIDPDAKVSDHYSTAPETPEPNIKSPIFESHWNGEDNSTSFSQLSSPLSQLSEPIMIAKLTGHHEIRLRLRQSDTSNGSNVVADFNLGSVVTFLSPRQLHVINELLSGFVSPDSVIDNSNARRGTSTNKPMKALDFERIERELQNQMISPTPDRSVMHHHGWSSQCLEDSDEEFFTFSTNTTSVLSISSADTTAQVNGGKPHRNPAVPPSSDEAMAESTQFILNLNSLVVVVLHDDILTPTEDGRVSYHSVIDMKSRAEDFFNNIVQLEALKKEDCTMEDYHFHLNSACKTNHLRFIGAPGTIDIVDKTLNNVKNVETLLRFGCAELVECLFDEIPTSSQISGPIYCNLLKFEKTMQNMSKSCSNIKMTMVNPCIKMKINYWEHCLSSGRRMRSETSPRTEIEFQFAPCVCEVDISIIDRIKCLLNPKPLHRKQQPAVSLVNGYHDFNQVIADSNSSPSGRLDFKFISPSLTLKIRFPIPDLRPLADMNRVPWWKQTIRKDALMLTLVDARLHTVLNYDNIGYSFEARCREFVGAFQEDPLNPPIQFLKAGARSDIENDSNVELGWPRISYKIKPPVLQSILEESDKDDDSNSGCTNGSIETLVHQLCNTEKIKEPSPFSSRKIIYKSERFKNRPKNGFADNKEDELILPGDRREANDFVEWFNGNCHIIVDICVEKLNVFLPSKHLYEVLYNRITVDLLLWTPTAIVPLPSRDNASFFNAPNTLNWVNGNPAESGVGLLNAAFQAFSMCKSVLKYDSGSDSDLSQSGEQQPSAFPLYGNRQNQNRGSETKKKLINFQNKLSLTINCRHVDIELYLPLRDNAGKVVPEYEGRIHLIATDCTFYTLASSDVSPSKGYIGLHANSAELYHKGCVSSSQLEPLLMGADSIKSKDNLILHLTENSAKIKPIPPVGIAGDSQDVLSLAVEFNFDPDRNTKKFRMALALRGATFNYYMTPNPECWFTQALDFFDVVDYPIMGYRPPEIVTEIFLHTWDCAVDYRPLHLPIRVFLTVENFSVSSSVLAQTNTTIIKLISEEAYLFLSKRYFNSFVNLQRDYVCVMDMSLFEFVMKITDGKNLELPKIDLEVFNNMLHIRTCVDSSTAVQDLLRYFANDGDIRTGDQDIDEDEISNGELTMVMLEEDNNISVNTMMEEAMRESLSPVREDTEKEVFIGPAKSSGDVFLFPGESESESRWQTSKLYPSLGNKSSGLTFEDDDDSSGSSFDDFCILGEDVGAGIMVEKFKPSRSAVPQARALVSESINIIDNHYNAPSEKSDELKAPKHFPHAVFRYTLREISIIWHLYGGNDFPIMNGNDDRLTKRWSRNSFEYGYRRDHFRDHQNLSISYCSTKQKVAWQSEPDEICRSPVTSSSSVRWLTQGGPGRQHDVLMELDMNKIRFQHETYPETAVVASRQILHVLDIEIRDRLASSLFNKFLYQYSSEDMPRKSHSNVFTLKALHRRSDPANATQECDLKVSVLPLRLNVDQDSVTFLSDYLGSFFSSGEDSCESDQRLTDCRKSNKYFAHQAPIMSVGNACATAAEKARKTSSPQLDGTESQCNLIEFDDSKQNLLNGSDELCRGSTAGTIDSSSSSTIPSPIFFSSFEFEHEVLIRLDYQGKRVDLEMGALAGILLGLGQLNCSELRLKRLSRRGVLGIDRLINDVINDWIQDIKHNQLPSLLGGVGPLHSVVQLFNGVRNLFWLPIEQYRKDGRIVRGLQKGANAFTTSTAMAVLELTNRFVETLQSTAETAYDVVSPGPPARWRRESRGSKIVPRKPCQPADIMEGVTNAYHVVKEGLGDTAMTLVRVASQEHEQKGISGAVGGVLRQIPSTVVKPIILATEATSNVLGGMKHQLAPDVRKEATEKWRSEC